MGSISWMGRTWQIVGENYNSGVWIDENGYLHTVICGGGSAECWLISYNAEFYGTHYVRSQRIGGVALWAPIWLATWDPAFCEIDIEMQNAKSNYHYNVWKRQTDPYEIEWFDNWTYTHPDHLTQDDIRLYGSSPNYSVRLRTWYYDGGWNKEHESIHTGPGVIAPGDGAHVWIGLTASAGSSGRTEIIFREYGFVAD